MLALAGFLQRFSRPVKIIIQVGILGVILATIGTVGFIEYSAQPGFCDNCHNMVPYYESWKTSSHNNVPCIKCHYAPGIKAEAMGKLQAANQVVKYITGAYGTKPWAEIEDASCLRSGCHSERALEGTMTIQGVQFEHSEHLGELRNGKQLRCTSCHSQIVQGEHLTVTETTCFLCHFKDRPPGQPIAGCTGCHSEPPTIVSPAGFVVDHESYVEDLVSCISCHDQVTTGSGLADESRCFQCHNEPERLAQFSNTTLMHRTHIAAHNVTCSQCHLPIEHRVVSMAETFQLDCNGCHQRVHESQRQLYSGMGGHGTEETPSQMFLARVSCKSCHGLPTEVAGHETVAAAGEATCMSCHGVRYANILPAWQEELEERVGLVRSALGNLREDIGAAARQRTGVDSLLSLASDNLGLVERGKGAHNIVYADKVLRAALDYGRAAAQASGRPGAMPSVNLGPPVSTNVCVQCHLGQQDLRTTFDGRFFDHEPHVLEADLVCTECHSGLEEHGNTVLESAADCSGCHHDPDRQLNCAGCHGGEYGAPQAPITTSVGTFSHPVHLEAGRACEECHTPPGMSAASLDCESCHDEHHQPQATCLGCHGEDGERVKTMHPIAAHDGCQACHGSAVAGLTSWSREVCTVCHSDRVEHNAPIICNSCHQVPDLQ